MNPPTPHTPNERQQTLSDSDQQWLDHLTGKLTQASDAEALKEATLLRAAILREHAASTDAAQTNPAKQVGPVSTSAEQAGIERLLFSLRRDGLLQSDTGANHASALAIKAKRPFWMMPSALAASVLVGFFALQALQLGQLSVQYDEPPTMRGQIQQIVMQDQVPKMKAQALVEKLKAAGLSARIYQTRERFVVDTDLIAEKLDSASQTLVELGIAPTVGQVRITVTPLTAKAPN
jgi:hypothetical protein